MDKVSGELYGPGMQFAEPYENAVKTLSDLSSKWYKAINIKSQNKIPLCRAKI